MYDVYPGSIVDVSTLKNTIKKINAQGVRSYTLIMDRSFFSTANIEELVSSNLSFIIPPASTLKNVKEAISAIHNSINDPQYQYLKLHKKEPLFVMPVGIAIGELQLKGYAYYDQRREQKERNTLYKRLYDLVERRYLFIAFLALILRMKLMRLMVKTDLAKRFSVEGLLTELEKIKVMILA